MRNFYLLGILLCVLMSIRVKADAKLYERNVAGHRRAALRRHEPGPRPGLPVRGLAEELINALTQEGLRIVSRTASFQFRASGADVQAVGRQLAVGTLLEGASARPATSCASPSSSSTWPPASHRGGRRFDRQLADVFAIQDEIAETVAASLGAACSRGARSRRSAGRRPARQPTQYYLRARHLPPHSTRASNSSRARDSSRKRSNSTPSMRRPTRASSARWPPSCEWFGGGDAELDRPSGPAAGRSNSRRLWPNRTWRAASCCRCRATTSRPGARSTRPSGSIRVPSRRITTTRATFAAGDIPGAADLFRQAGEVRQEDLPEPDACWRSARDRRASPRKRWPRHASRSRGRARPRVESARRARVVAGLRGAVSRRTGGARHRVGRQAWNTSPTTRARSSTAPAGTPTRPQ